jgi:hypothetical protein
MTGLGVGLAAVLTTMAMAAVAMAAVASGTYSGSTTQTGQPNGTVHFRVTADHQTVQAFSGDVWATCSKAGASQSVHITLEPTRDMAIRHLAFGFSGNFNIDNGDVVIAKHVHGRITGRFASGRQVAGTMKFSWTFDHDAPASVQGLSCTTQTVHYTAQRT